MFAITGGMHRYFAHRTFKTSRPFQFLLAFLSETASQKGVLWWAGHHRHHHNHSDQPNDLHSPIQSGFAWAHIGWILSDRYEDTPWHRIRDYSQYPELVWLNRYWLVPPVVYAVGLFLIGGWSWLFWGFFLSTTLLWHGTFLVNSMTHLWGRRRYPTTDQSRNSLLIALATMGEGWHNNHHYHASSCRQGFYWWEIDVTYYILKGLARLRLIWDLRVPPEITLEMGKRRNRARLWAEAAAQRLADEMRDAALVATESVTPQDSAQ